MLNDIARNHQHMTPERAAVAVASHVLEFWARSMLVDLQSLPPTAAIDLNKVAELARRILAVATEEARSGWHPPGAATA